MKRLIAYAIRGAERFLRQQHSLHVIRSLVVSAHNIGDEPLVSGKREVEQRVDTALVKLCDLVPARPRFSDKIAISLNTSPRLRQEPQEFHVGIRIPVNIVCHRIQPESVNSLPQPVFEDRTDLASYGFARKIQVRHFRPESRLVIPLRTFHRRVPVSRLPGEIVIIVILTVGSVRLPSGRQFVQVIHRRLEPGVVVRSVVQHQVHIYTDAPLVAFRK